MKNQLSRKRSVPSSPLLYFIKELKPQEERKAWLESMMKGSAEEKKKEELAQKMIALNKQQVFHNFRNLHYPSCLLIFSGKRGPIEETT